MKDRLMAECDTVIAMLEQEPYELEAGIRGELLTQYRKLIDRETQCMKKIKDCLYRIPDEQF